MGIANVIVLLGGVAMFLYGMSLMGDGLKKVAGNKLELILYRLSSTPLKGILLGTGVTAVIQSSSATSVMVVGFVNSAMMGLRQAIAVIMGAIIGTSVTGWVICLSGVGGASSALSLFSTESISAVTAIAGILLRMTGRKDSVRHVGNILMGFAVLMFGMKTMSGSVSGLKEDPGFINVMTQFSNPVLGILIGFAITAILQSASASVGVLQALACTGAIGFDVALPIILGVGLGASVPVLISSHGSSRDGKRAAVTYPVTEILRAVLFGAVFYVLNSFLHFDFMKKPVNMFDIALINTLFRVSTILVLSLFIPLIEKLVCRIIPSREGDEEDTEDMNRLEERFLAYPSLAVEQTRMAIQTMARLTEKDLAEALALLSGKYNEAGFREVENLEGLIDRYEDKIGSYLMKLTGRELNDAQNKAVSQYLRAITDLERISDHALNIAERAREMAEKKVKFTDKAKKEMENLIAAITEIVQITFTAFREDDIGSAYRVEPLEQVIDQICRKMKAHHTERLQKGKCTITNGYIFNDLISDFERVSDHCSNIGIVIVELKANAMDVHEMSGMIKQEHVNGFDTYYSEYRARFLSKKEEPQT